MAAPLLPKTLPAQPHLCSADTLRDTSKKLPVAFPGVVGVMNTTPPLGPVSPILHLETVQVPNAAGVAGGAVVVAFTVVVVDVVEVVVVAFSVVVVLATAVVVLVIAGVFTKLKLALLTEAPEQPARPEAFQPKITIFTCSYALVVVTESEKVFDFVLVSTGLSLLSLSE